MMECLLQNMSITRERVIQALKVVMIIKGLFRRYERWNPVHPTSGAFWGMGIGVGCGVGWGPGFGPEVVGYVGAGCGVGFSVGITFAGFGIGLPANFIYEIPYNAFTATRSGALEFARSSGICSTKILPADGWSNIGTQTSELQKRFSGFKRSLDNRVDFSDMNNLMSSHARSALDSFEKFRSHFTFPR